MAYNPQKDAVVISKPFGAIGFPIDGRSFFYDEANFVRRAFVSTAEVLAYFDTPFKREGMFYVFVNSTGTLQPDGTILGGTRVAYWWKEGTADNQLIVVVAKGDKGDAFTFDDFTPGEIELLQQPAIDAAEIADIATNNANIATGLANTATNNANTATSQANTARDSANTAATAANTATTNANTATSEANDARDEALAAAIVANGARGWQPEYGLESDGAEREVQKLIRWVGGTGSTPIDYVGKYIGSTGFVDTKAEATNVKGNTGEQGPTGITTPNLPANTLAGNPTGGTASPQGLTPIGTTIGSDGKFYNAVESGVGNLKVVRVKNPLGGALKGSPTETGAIRIKLPTNATMMLHISGGIYFYDETSASNRSCRFSITCYSATMGNGYSATFTGRKAPNFPVRLYTDGVDRYIYIGDLSQTYINTGLSITDVEAYFSGATIPLIASGWAISFETAFVGTLVRTLTDNYPQSNQQQIISDFIAGANVRVLNTDTKNQRDGKFQGQIDERIPYTGATKAVDLNTQQLSLGGNFIKNQDIFEQVFLWAGATSSHFRELNSVVALSKINDTSTIGDIIVTLPIKTTTRWVTEILISDRIRTAKILVQAEGVSSTSKYCALIQGNTGFITEVKFGRDIANGNTILIIKRDTGTSPFSYGKVVINKFYHSVTFDAALEVKSNYKIEFLDEATLTGITSIVSVPVISQLTNGGSALNLIKGDGSYLLLSTLAAFTATKLATPRQINGVDFDGTANITVADSTKEPTANKSITLTSPDDIKFPTTKAVSDALALKAPIASPTFTGTVGGITATMVGAPSGSGTSTGTNTGDQTWTTLSGKPTFATVATTGAYADLSGTPSLAGYAPLASPTFTGTPVIPSNTQPLSVLSQSGATTGQVPKWNGSAWIPYTPSGGATIIKASTTLGYTDIFTNFYKDVTVAGASVGDFADVVEKQFNDSSNKGLYFVTAKVTATNTVRIYITRFRSKLFSEGQTILIDTVVPNIHANPTINIVVFK